MENKTKTIIIEKLIKLIGKYSDNSWSWKFISSNPNINIEVIEKYPDKNWNWSLISKNKNIIIEIIEKYPDKPWNWNIFQIITLKLLMKMN